ncbi:MAG: hypothetical protein ACKVPJ_00550 [Chitinophagales bacterium]
MKYWFICILSFLAAITSAQDCSQTSTGFIPIADLAKNTFQGFTGGKYPGGSNSIPAEHYKNGMQACNKIQPLDADGKIDSINGSIGFLVLGFSTAAMTGRYFRDLSAIMNINDRIKIIIGAQGGKDINSMTFAESRYWFNCDSIIRSKQLTSEQIQVAWVTTGDIRSYQLPFPEQSTQQIEKYRNTILNIKKFYPNIQCIFISDRTYAGYIPEGKGPQDLREPTAYYSSWAVKWLIEKQIEKTAGFSYEEIPFIDWGPLLWTDGEKGNARGYTWDCVDADKGGIHPTSKGRAKEAILLYHFFTNHPYTKRWFYAEQNK